MYTGHWNKSITFVKKVNTFLIDKWKCLSRVGGVPGSKVGMGVPISTDDSTHP